MKPIHTYLFQNPKYTWNMPVSIVTFDEMRNDLQYFQHFTLNFYSISIVTDANEYIIVRGQRLLLKPNVVITLLPGELCRIDPHTAIQGWTLAFKKEFLVSVFHNPKFMDQFIFLDPKRPSPYMLADEKAFQRIQRLFLDMREEVEAKADNSAQLLHAILYGTLVYLDRIPLIDSKYHVLDKYDKIGYMIEKNRQSQISKQFEELLAKHYCDEHEAKFYADSLCISTTYLNKIVTKTFGCSTKEGISKYIIYQACRNLLHTPKTIQQISLDMGFESETYFIRFFRKHMGVTPKKYRDNSNKTSKLFVNTDTKSS